jgi:hypothetical protein
MNRIEPCIYAGLVSITCLICCECCSSPAVASDPRQRSTLTVVFWPDGHSFSTERIDVSGFPHNDADLKIPLCTFTVAHNHHASDETE